ncbi:PepSY-like domain-containing protein [Mediterranea massiliensis]|jgi:hypothetical protein|uniref:PepSY-like domain-containing protein n=1 Tax=Mediterranea massiliensis TaxID=1841865 RepID=UPI0025A3C45E|nr:PepSY-like domain-containing protein [Mediterranea massiliensis]MDM8336233.1 PepSY-like domain-containing protein [Mediterranea massiliensis]
MKKFLALLFMAFLTIQATFAGDVITQDAKQLPLVARNFINRHFTRPQISYIKIDSEFLSKKYEVVLSDRTKIEFNGDGEWEEVDGKRNNIPTTIIPAHIKQYVEANYPGVSFTKIERDRGEVEVELTNRLSLTFNKKGQLIDIDD